MKIFGSSGRQRDSLKLNLAISPATLKERSSGLSISQSFVTTDCIKQTKSLETLYLRLLATESITRSTSSFDLHTFSST